MGFARDQSGLFKPFNFIRRHRGYTRTIVLPNGDKAKLIVDDSRTVAHIERPERLDAIVRPQTRVYKLRRDL